MFSADVRSRLECVRPVDHDIITMNQQLNIDTLETPTQQQQHKRNKEVYTSVLFFDENIIMSVSV